MLRSTSYIPYHTRSNTPIFWANAASRSGWARALRLSSNAEADSNPGAPPIDIVMPARSILVAAGTQPNTVLGREEPQHVTIDGKYFQAFDEDGRKVTPERITKPAASHVLMSVRPDGRAISFFGDLHPSYAGNVVKAMASAKQGYPVVSRMLARRPPSDISPRQLIARPSASRRIRTCAADGFVTRSGETSWPVSSKAWKCLPSIVT